MQWHDFVFSKKRAFRLLRHLVFWTAWWIYFTICQYTLEQPSLTGFRPQYILMGSYIEIKTFLLVCVYVIACYSFIYVLLPQLLKGKQLKAISGIFFLSAVLFTAAYLMFWHIFPFVDSIFGTYKPAKFTTWFWPAVSLGLIDPLKVIAAAAIIKYIKYWWLKQKESERLEREKINAELQLLKAQIHPGFLFHSLQNIYAYSLIASPKASEMLLKLSDLLSYMLYECDEPLVPLEKEVEMMKDYMALEKIRLNESIEMELNVRGDLTGKMVAPFLLLPFIENSFVKSQTHEQAWMNIDISVEGNVFSLKLAKDMIPDTSNVQQVFEKGLADVQKRLTLIYPQKHELKINREREMLIVLLKIHFDEALIDDEQLVISESTISQPKLYAAR